jgi:hypothetical protein
MIRGRTIWIVAEIALFLCGVTLLAIYGGSRLYSRFQAKSAIAKFEALNEAYSRTISSLAVVSALGLTTLRRSFAVR